MIFTEPLWLIVGLAACSLLWWRYRKFDRRQNVALTTFASSHLLDQLTRSVSAGRRTLKRALLMGGVVCVFVALARPQAGYGWEETRRRGLDILFAVDTSKSMLTQDVKPDRLTRAKLAVNDLVDKLDGDQVGLIAFAGEAFLQSPMTLDYDAFRESLNALDTTVVPRGGTDIARAIREARAAFGTENNHDKILVLVTDGEDLEGSAIAAAEAAAKDGVKIFTVGVGTTTGELIPVRTENGGTEFVKDASGQFVKSRLDEAMLKKIATVTGGMYQPLGQRSEGLTAIYSQGLEPFQRHNLASRQHRVYLEQFQWPLLLALCCFLAEFLVGTRKRLRRAFETPVSSNTVRFARSRPKLAAPTAAAALVLAMLACPGFVQASPQSAEKAYKNGAFADAAKQYGDAAVLEPGKAELEFNVGAAAYKAAMFEKAAEAFRKSLKTDQVQLQQSTYYNLGNTQYRLGQKTEKTDPQQTIPIWQQAIQSFDAALELKADDADSHYNRDLVKKKLDKLQQQQKQNKNNKDQKDKEQKNQDQKNQDQAKQDQKSQDQKNQDQAKQDQKNQGQKNQDVAKQDQKNQGQKNQDVAKQDQKKQEQGKQDQQKQAGKQPLAPQFNGPDPARAEPKKSSPEEPGESQRVPGQMTREEAKDLLDSLKNDEHRLPAAPVARNRSQDDNKPLLKDW